MSAEKSIFIESVKIAHVRDGYGQLADLGLNIATAGLRHPITLWSDGTLLSGSRRLRAHFLLSGGPDASRFRKIKAVFVDTIEAAAERIAADNADDYLAQPMKPTEILRLWEVLRQLDAPAARIRADANRRRGVELRRQVMAGARPPGRTKSRTEDYALATMAAPFGMSEANASRLVAIHKLATSSAEGVRAEQAREALRNIDDGLTTISGNYTRLVSGRSPAAIPPKPFAAVDPAPAAKQRQGWDRALPQLEGLVDGLTELGPPNPALTWDQVGPVHARLMAVRRNMEKIINQMKKVSQ